MGPCASCSRRCHVGGHATQLGSRNAARRQTGVDDLGAAPVVESDVEQQATVAPGLLLGALKLAVDVVDHIVSEGWDVDFFMCCVYERHRTREELQALLGAVPIPVIEPVAPQLTKP